MWGYGIQQGARPYRWLWRVSGAYQSHESTHMPENTTTPVEERLDKLPQVLSRVPTSRSGWYQGIKDGRFPKPVKLGARSVAWKRSDIDKLIESLQTA